MPAELQGRDLTRGESDLKGHIKGAEEGANGSGSAAYVPPDPKDDCSSTTRSSSCCVAQKTDPAFPPNPEKAVLNQ